MDPPRISYSLRQNGVAAVTVGGWLTLIILLTVWVYFPGLTGGMVFDDKPNLGKIGANGGVTDVDTLIAFILSSDSLHGRPLSLLTFVIDDQHWPMNTWALKRTNLAIHLLNGLLIFWLVLLLLDGYVKKHRSLVVPCVAFFCSALWLVNPFQISTVSYIVQRMTELSATFVLFGMIIYWKMRNYLNTNFWSTIIALSFMLMLLLVLGIASKESALLMVLFLFLMETCFWRGSLLVVTLHRKVWSIWKFFCFFGPLILFLVYWFINSNGFSTGYEHRQFSLTERLMTESRIIWAYVSSIFFPRLSYTGLFAGDIAISSGIFSPFTTFLSITGLVLVSSGAWRLRVKLPLVSFGILFFLAGHLMESTFIPLELYFEHRNYLPQFGLWVASIGVALKLCDVINWRLIIVGATIYLALFAFITYNSALLWGNSKALAEVWYSNNPGSLRSLQFLASEQYESGRRGDAEALIQRGLSDFPHSLALPLTDALLKCGRPEFSMSGTMLIEKASNAEVETAAFESLQLLTALYSKGTRCPGLDYKTLIAIYSSLIRNPYYSANAISLSRIYEQIALISIELRDLNDAMYYYDKACEVFCSAGIRFNQVELLISAGLWSDAGVFLEHGKRELQSSVVARLKHPYLLLRMQKLDDLVSKNARLQSANGAE